MTDLVARLREAIDETERIAQRTLNGPFEGMRAGVFTDHHESPPVQGTIVRISMLPMSWAEGPFAPIYIAYDPAAVLRRCAADRKILDLHAPGEYRTSSGGIPRTVLQCEHCAELCHSRSGLACDDPCDAVYPCETVKLIAEAYGIEA